jgi:hypothetical protein
MAAALAEVLKDGPSVSGPASDAPPLREQAGNAPAQRRRVVRITSLPMDVDLHGDEDNIAVVVARFSIDGLRTR